MSRKKFTNMKTLGASVLAVGILLSATACNKKVAAPAPPAPVAKAPEAPPPPPPPAAARITNFAAEPRSIQRGQSSTLSWSVANATDISIDNGVGTVQANGTRQVSPNNATSYTLTARGPGGSVARLHQLLGPSLWLWQLPGDRLPRNPPPGAGRRRSPANH